VSHSVRDRVDLLSATVWLDIGLRCELEAVHLKRFRNVRPVIASESLGRGAPLIRATPNDVLKMRPALSLDLRNGELISASARWASPIELAEQMHLFGYRTFILLDLARVGMNAGPGTEPLCRELRRRFPDIELLVGGGIRNRDDICRLEDAGADGVLIASALHDGTLP
jgi:phosphoribosylformimino-5-aminoimidazole carboxamide ribotide isomerase